MSTLVMALLKTRIATPEKEIMEKHSANVFLLERSHLVIGINKKTKETTKQQIEPKTQKTNGERKNYPAAA